LREVLAGEDPGEVASLLADAAEDAGGMGRPLFSGLQAPSTTTQPGLARTRDCNGRSAPAPP
jgi:hypothetical protein